MDSNTTYEKELKNLCAGIMGIAAEKIAPERLPDGKIVFSGSSSDLSIAKRIGSFSDRDGVEIGLHHDDSGNTVSTITVKDNIASVNKLREMLKDGLVKRITEDLKISTPNMPNKLGTIQQVLAAVNADILKDCQATVVPEDVENRLGWVLE